MIAHLGEVEPATPIPEMTPMPVLVLGDLHLDQWLEQGSDPFGGQGVAFWTGLDALIIAGDLCDKPKVRWPTMLAHVGRYVSLDRAHVFPDNHDFYHHVLDGEARLEDLSTHYAQKRQIVTGDTRFLCCTLWTDFAAGGDVSGAMAEARQWMNYYRFIRMQGAKYRKIRPEDTREVHRDHRAWLESALATPFAGRTVVVTHHGPVPGVADGKTLGLEPTYTSDLTALIDRYQPDAWLFGHTHTHTCRSRCCRDRPGSPTSRWAIRFMSRMRTCRSVSEAACFMNSAHSGRCRSKTS
jgi:Icc-related predicted phosphoesterase